MCELQEICEEGEEDCNNAMEIGGAKGGGNNAKDDTDDDPDAKKSSIPTVVVGILVVLVLLLVAVLIVYCAVCRGKKKTGKLPVSSEGTRTSKKTRNVNV